MCVCVYVLVQDDGVGMNVDELERMMDFGHCEDTDDGVKIGRYGVGFKQV